MSVLAGERELAWMRLVNADPEFRVVGRWSRVLLTLANGERRRSYRIDRSDLAVDEAGGLPEVVLEGSPSAWSDFLAPMPPRHSHHVLAMDRRREDFAVTAGRDELIRHLRVIDVVLQLMREVCK